MSRKAASAIVDCLHRAAQLARSSSLNVVLSAGATPTRTYELLATEYRSKFDWSRVTLYQMDEYLDSSNPSQDFREYLISNVLTPLCIREAHLIDRKVIGDAEASWQASISRHERRLVADGGIALAVHGIGRNGHIGFNEPGAARSSTGRVVRLAPATRATAGPDISSSRGVTLGMATLLAARENLLLASGASKAEAVAEALDGPISSRLPASWLRSTPALTVIVDAPAAAMMKPNKQH